MNIFATNDCPIKSALALDDRRIIKMILESAQMLSTALRRHDVGNGPHYKSAYQNHPCTLWTGYSRQNYDWLCNHALAMCAIYSSISSGKTHASEGVIQFCYKMRHKIPSKKFTEFVDCTEFKDRTDLTIHERYQMFMNLKWNTRDTKPPRWSRRKVPDWRVIC